jgi:hypothetical protein
MEPLKHLLFIDIETACGRSEFAQLSEGMQREWLVKAKGKWNTEAADAPQAFIDKAGIFAEFGKIVCISIGCFVEKDGNWKLVIRSFRGDNEQELLDAFCASLHKFNKRHQGIVFVGHNIKEFDLPFISRRMVIHGLCLPDCLRMHGKKPWEVPHVDTMQLWSFGDYKSYTKLSLLAEVLGIPSPKDDISGEDVTRVYWQERNLQRIVNYCQKDVETTAKVYMRLMCYEEVSFTTEVMDEIAAA